MNTLLIFFALPIAVIIISIALQKILKCPFLVAGVIFAIFLVVTFIVGDLTFLVATIVYTIIAFITAVLTKIICRILCELYDRDSRIRRCRCECSNNNNNGTQLLSINGSCLNNNDNGNLLTISSNGCNGIENELLTINTNCSGRRTSNNGNCNGSSNCNCSTSNNPIAVTANVFPNSSSNGNAGCFSGCYRRRRS